MAQLKMPCGHVGATGGGTRPWSLALPAPHRGSHARQVTISSPSYLPVAVLAVCTMRSYTRAADVPAALRRRQMKRPKTFHRRREHDDRKAISMSPTVPTDDVPNRTSWAEQERLLVKKARSPKELEKILTTAASAGRLEESVINAAMQTCGYKFWWDALLDLRCWKTELGMKSSPIGRNIFIAALNKASKGLEREYKQQALQLAKEMWQEAAPDTASRSYKAGVGAVLSLCAASDEPDALAWAEEIWGWAKNHEEFQPDDLHRLDYMRVLERHSLYDRVDGFLLELRHVLNAVALGGLLTIASEARNWRRADALWDVVVKELGVMPNVICYTAWAQAHLVCGRPVIAALILETMFKSETEVEDDRSPTVLAHALLYVYHSSPTPANLKRLMEAEAIGDELIRKHSSNISKHHWEQAKSCAAALKSDPESLTLHEVIARINTHRRAPRNAMLNWPDYAAGTNYLATL